MAERGSDEIRRLRVVSLFAGIGGLSYAFKRAAEKVGIECDFIHHFDISSNCQRTWQLNHPDHAERYSLKDVQYMRLNDPIPAADVWLLSPPCQPFTIGGNELHERDNRAQGFLSLINLFASRDLDLEGIPKILFIENVPAFGTSASMERFCEIFGEKYHIIQRYLSPTSVGVPYTRHRFYAMAIHRSMLQKDPPNESELREEFPVENACADEESPTRKVWEYLDGENNGLVGEWPLTARFDLITRASKLAGTITGGYGERLGKQGPLVVLGGSSVCPEGDAMRFRPISPHESVRRLSPTEIMRLHGWPTGFRFPPDLALRKIYKLLGNSIRSVFFLATHLQL